MKDPMVVSCLDLTDDEGPAFKRDTDEMSKKQRSTPRQKRESTSSLYTSSPPTWPGKPGPKPRKRPSIPGPTSQHETRSKTKPENAYPDPSKNPAIQAAFDTTKAEPLDFSKIRQEPLPESCKRPEARPFGLEHCPVFYPTPEQFAHPLEYIESVANKSREYGILKVVPPKEWKPPFVLDTEKFRFNTRLQRLNSMEASSRANVNFVEQLTVFHEQRNQSKSKIYLPTIGSRPVDLWRLKREVSQLGGFQEVTASRQWPWVARRLGYDPKTNAAYASQIKNAYSRIILPYEQYVAKLKTPQASPSTPRTKTTRPNNYIVDAQNHTTTEESQETPPDSVLTSPVSYARIQQASERLREVLNPTAEARNNRNGKDSNNPGRATRVKACEVCRLRNERGQIVMCDDCERAYHVECLMQPPKVKPKAEWICDECIVSTGDDYGFEEGNEHSFKSFFDRAQRFRKKWLNLHPLKVRNVQFDPENGEMDKDLQQQMLLEDHFEREFWRVVESQSETVEVEYGADLHTTNCGSGLPDIERHPMEPYSRDGWNLNNLPVLPASLLRYIKTDISGMTVPWLYVGMLFSTFAWHKEDHYSYSINYQHMGDTKTWYGVPGDDDKLLEEAVKKAAPELFEHTPDLMFQLVTLMSPGRLKRAGVRVYACDQRPREFVITLPKAYHTGFNHGFNVNEAVNFSLPDWLPQGLECVQHYKQLHKQPVFSHDELLHTISQQDRSPRTSKWLLPLFTEMVEREIAFREKAREALPDLVEVIDDNSRPEEHDQCLTCKGFCHLSQIVSLDTTKSACVEHISDLEKGPMTLRKRFEDEELYAMLSRIQSRAAKAGKLGDSLIGSNIDPDQRKSGRRRNPSAAALEAAGEDMPSLASKLKRSISVDGEEEDYHVNEYKKPALSTSSSPSLDNESQRSNSVDLSQKSP